MASKDDQTGPLPEEVQKESRKSDDSFEDLTEIASRDLPGSAENGQQNEGESYEMGLIKDPEKLPLTHAEGTDSIIDENQHAQENKEHKNTKFFFTSSPDAIDGGNASRPKRISSYPRKIFFPLNEVAGTKATPARYLRFGGVTSMDNLYNHLLEKWPDDICPELAITFLGGCEEHLLTEIVTESLRNCIASILRKFSCLLLTRGSNVGITKLIGKVCNDESLKLKHNSLSRSTGILPWECVYGKEHLPFSQGVEGVFYDSRIQQNEHPLRDFPLDPNQHDYFLVDGGRGQDFGVVDVFSWLNWKFCKDLIPCMMCLVGGGITSLKIMYEVLFPSELQKVTSIPVVIVVKGSGKLADLLSYCHEQNNGQEAEPLIEDAVKAYLNSAVDQDSKDIFKKFIEVFNGVSEYKNMVTECLSQKRDQIFVFEADCSEDSKNDLETLMLRAAKKGAEHSESSHLIFAIHSDDPFLVKSLLKKAPNGAFRLMTKELLDSNSLFRVKELLERYDLDAKGYVCTEGRLLELYKVNKNNENRFRTKESEVDAITLIKYFKEHFKKEVKRKRGLQSLTCIEIDKAMQFLTMENTAAEIHTFEDGTIKINEEIINAMQALLINSALILDVKAAKLFWYFDQYNPLSNALLVYTLLSGVEETKKTTNIFKKAPEEFNSDIKHFESLMTLLLDAYYKTSKEMTEKVLLRKIPLWRNHTLIEVAGDIGLKSFIAKPCCQALLSKEWRNKVDDKKYHSCCSSPICKPFCSIGSFLAAPNVKLVLHVLMYIVSFLAFGFYVLFPKTVAHDPIKWIVMVVMLSLTLDEIRQVTAFEKNSALNLKQWASSAWNIFDLIAILLFFAGFGLSFHKQFESKIIFSLYLFISCLKILQFLRAWNFLGVYMIMIGKMLGRMKTFLIVVIVSVIGYGVFMTALLHPDTAIDGHVLLFVLLRPYLLLFGESGLEHFEFQNTTTVFGTKTVNRFSEVLVILGMAAFLLFANTLLINLMIADFSNIHQKVLDQSEEVWKYEKFVLLQEFKKKPILPIPFSIFENCYYLFLLAFKKQTNGTGLQDDHQAEEDRREIADFERFCFKMLFPKAPEEL